jgi:PKD repeat protein
MATDAQTFGRPVYDDSGTTDRVALRVAGPHLDVDGSNATGSFEAVLPRALLDAWNVFATQLAGELDGTSRASTAEATSGGGARVAFDVHYSAVDAAVTVDTTPPTADAGGNRTVDVGAAVAFDAGASADDVGVAGYEWDFGDGETATGATPTHTFASPGNYTVTLTVTDAAGNVDADTVVVAAVDVTAPRAEAGPSRTVDVNESVVFDGGASTDDDGIVSYRWSFGDGDWTSGERVYHTYVEPGTYTAWLRVEDAAGNVDRDAVGVTVVETETGTEPAPSCPIVGERRATSVDDDARCEDVNGDGRFSLSDVTFLFNNRAADAVTSNADAFDFNGDGAFTLSDFTRLFLEEGTA